MTTNRFWLLIYLILGLFALSLVFLNGGLLALALPFVLYLGAAWWMAPETVELEAGRTLSAKDALSGRAVDVELKIVNRGQKLSLLHFWDQTPEALALQSGENEALLALSPDEETGLGYTIKGRRGKYTFAGVRVESSDPFNVFQATVHLPLKDTLLVMPEVQKLWKVPIRPRQTRGFAGPLPSRQAGSGVDFFGVRQYELGDSLRRVNWRISTRHLNDLFTNEFEQDRIADVGLILDARQQSDFKIHGESLFDHSVDAAASLADFFISQGHRVSLLVYGYSIERVFAGYGKVQRERILQTLARAATGFNYALESLYYLPTRLFPTHSQLVMVSPLNAEDLPVLVRLRSQGYEVMVISPDPIAFEDRLYHDVPGADLARRLAYVERGLLFRKMRQIGVQAVNWSVDQPLSHAIRGSLGIHSVNTHRLERLP